MGMVFESHRVYGIILDRVLANVNSTTHNTFTKPILDLVSSDNVKEILAGGLAGITAKAMFMPLDVIRKRLQVQGPVRKDIVVRDVPR